MHRMQSMLRKQKLSICMRFYSFRCDCHYGYKRIEFNFRNCEDTNNAREAKSSDVSCSCIPGISKSSSLSTSTTTIPSSRSTPTATFVASTWACYSAAASTKSTVSSVSSFPAHASGEV